MADQGQQLSREGVGSQSSNITTDNQRPTTQPTTFESETLNAFIYNTSTVAERLAQNQPANQEENIANAVKAALDFERRFGGV